MFQETEKLRGWIQNLVGTYWISKSTVPPTEYCMGAISFSGLQIQTHPNLNRRSSCVAAVIFRKKLIW